MSFANTSRMLVEGLRYQLPRLGVPTAGQYRSGNLVPWMSDMIDLGKEKNFFESRVTEYRRGASLSRD